MTHLKSKFIPKKTCWEWIIFISKAYIIIVPMAVLLSGLIGKIVEYYEPGMRLVSYWDARMQAKIMDAEAKKEYRLIECGYSVCLVFLLLAASLAGLKSDNARLRSAIFFIALTIFLMVFFFVMILAML